MDLGRLDFEDLGSKGLRVKGLGFLKIYLWPEKPTFLGFLIMVSIYNFLKRSVLGSKPHINLRFEVWAPNMGPQAF